MTRVMLISSILRRLWIVVCFLLTACVALPVALAQHPGHVGVGGHIGGVPRVAAPHVAVPPRFSPSRAILPPRFSSRPSFPGIRTATFRTWSPHPGPMFPIGHRPVFFGPPFFRFGLGFGFNSFWWPGCAAYWSCPFTCNLWPYYGYSLGNYLSLYVPPVQPVQTYQYPTVSYPLYVYGGERRDRVQLFLKDGTVYEVTDYWLVDSQFHFTTIERGKPAEQTIALDDLDLQTTIEVNTRRGFRFVLRNEPLEQYRGDHPDVIPPLAQPPQPEDPGLATPPLQDSPAIPQARYL